MEENQTFNQGVVVMEETPTLNQGVVGAKYNHCNLVTMNRETVIRIMKSAGGYVTPSLNEKLYLHNNNFMNIGGLEDFIEAKVIWLQSNALVHVHGLTHLKQLRVLYLHQNRITSLSGLAGLHQLHTLNVSVNALRSLHGVAHLPGLKNLYAAKNCFTSCESVSEIQNLSNLAVLDLGDNRIDGDGILYILSQPKLGELCVLTLQGNLLCTSIRWYRKVLISKLKTLKVLSLHACLVQKYKT